MINKMYLVLLLSLLCSCSSVEYYDLPEAFLVVDGKPYPMTSGSSCWDEMCSDSFSRITEKKPVLINENSKLQIYFHSKSKIREVYLSSISTEFFEEATLPYEENITEDREYYEKFNAKYSTWKEKPEHE
ncbi:MAG TPA: hypothetical protein VGE32_16915, partial [Cellvibrio sp.]